jgi:hypothetical protein
MKTFMLAWDNVPDDLQGILKARSARQIGFLLLAVCIVPLMSLAIIPLLIISKKEIAWMRKF